MNWPARTSRPESSRGRKTEHYYPDINRLRQRGAVDIIDGQHDIIEQMSSPFIEEIAKAVLRPRSAETQTVSGSARSSEGGSDTADPKSVLAPRPVTLGSFSGAIVGPRSSGIRPVVKRAILSNSF